MSQAEVQRCRMRLNEDPCLQADVLDVYHLGPAAIVACLRGQGFNVTVEEYEALNSSLTIETMTDFERLVVDPDPSASESGEDQAMTERA